MSRTRTGRPPKLEPWRVERLVAAIHTLASHRARAAYAGLAPSTVTLWMEYGKRDRLARLKRGDEQEQPGVYEKVMATIEMAEAEGELRALGEIALAGERGEHRAFEWLLERWHPDYARSWFPRRVTHRDAIELGDAIVKATAELEKKA